MRNVAQVKHDPVGLRRDLTVRLRDQIANLPLKHLRIYGGNLTVPLKNPERSEPTRIILLSEFSPSMHTSLLALLITLRSILRSRLDLQFEILALRHQIGVLQRSAKKRPRLT